MWTPAVLVGAVKKRKINIFRTGCEITSGKTQLQEIENIRNVSVLDKTTNR